ncbi:MAG: glycoside hydrolase family 3 N-terminal domain-containing protein [Schleiferiaceae bacterium]
MHTRFLKAIFTASLLTVFPGKGLYAQSFNVDSALSAMTLDEKIGQLFMVAAYSNKSEDHQAELEKLVREYHIGGVITMQGGPERQNKLLHRLQSAASFPLLVGQDAEWGQAMRLDSTYKFPTSLTVGAAGGTMDAYYLGHALADECTAVGVHMSFSPVLDVNTNPNNPIIGARSFGSDPDLVNRLGVAVVKGIQENDVLACGKHFPGHGDTHQDSHKTLPKVDRTLSELMEVEWVPFKGAIDAGVGAIMIAHLNIPSLEPSGKPTSLSRKVIQEILRDQWGYEGLIITDALNMKGAAAFAPPGELELAAFAAGNDILLFPMDVPKATKAFQDALATDKISFQALDERVRRILVAKSNCRAYADWLEAQKSADPTFLTSDHGSFEREDLNQRVSFNLIRNAATLLERGTATFPIKNVEQNFLHIALGDFESATTVKEYLDRYVAMSHHHGVDVDDREMASQDAFVVTFHQNTKNPWRRYKLEAYEKELLARLAATGKPTYIVHFANPYGVLTYPNLGQNFRVLIMYENDEYAQLLAPQFLFGARETKGSLPVDLSQWGSVGNGEKTEELLRLKYGMPFEVGLDAGPLNRIDSTVEHAIAAGATPGVQVLVARHGTVVYTKSFGSHTYSESTPVEWTDLYDIASVTKITATLPGIMKWYEKQPLLLKTTLVNHMSRLDGSGKEHLVFEDVLAHQSGLDAWIPYYVHTIKSDSASAYWYSSTPQLGYTQIHEGMYVRQEIRDTMFHMLAKSEMKAPEYRYSDLGYYLFKEMLEERFNEPLDEWVANTFYGPIGAQRLTYNPLERGFSLDELVPTEEDGYWRKTTVHGRVHDMGAAMLGGVAGHAGLFANTNDLAKMMQMYLNGGYYGGVRYFQESTIAKFSSCAFCEIDNRRGLGFDKKQLDDGPGPSCACASDMSFGHTGFTGTMVWMDPKEGLLYIFLSNRTYPDAENGKLSTLDVRTNIQGYLYDALN